LIRSEGWEGRAVFETNLRFPLFLTAILAAFAPVEALADCGAKVAAFDSAYAAKSAPDLLAAYKAITDDSVCGFDIDDYRPRAIDAMIDIAADPRHAADRDAALKFSIGNINVAGDWRLAERLADYYARTGRQGNARYWYEQGIAFVDSRPATPASVADRMTLLNRAAAAKIVASDDNEGRNAVAFAPSLRDLDGHVGGIYTRDLLRGAVVEAVPLPINFVYAQTTFTPTGAVAAAELTKALIEQNVHSLRLIGHADPRGDRMANLILSEQRALAVKAFLLANGVNAKIATEGVGADEEFDISTLAYRPTQEETWALDRRVEFVREER
jgi:outer membrane protein OmpA-like peptidoglycan-associated protein